MLCACLCIWHLKTLTFGHLTDTLQTRSSVAEKAGELVPAARFCLVHSLKCVHEDARIDFNLITQQTKTNVLGVGMSREKHAVRQALLRRQHETLIKGCCDPAAKQKQHSGPLVLLHSKKELRKMRGKNASRDLFLFFFGYQS